MSNPTLGTVTLIETEQSGWDYPQRAQVVPVLGADPSTGLNAVLQSSARTFRQATLTFLLPDLDDANTIRGYYEDVSEQTYTDHYGNTRGVRVIAFNPQGLAVNYWSCTATLVETTEPS